MAMVLTNGKKEVEFEVEDECSVEFHRNECMGITFREQLAFGEEDGEVFEVHEENSEEVDECGETKGEGYEVDEYNNGAEEEVFSSGSGESGEGQDEQEEEVSSRVRVLIKFKTDAPSVVVRYNEDGEQVEFERHDSSDQTESDSDEDDDVREDEDKVRSEDEAARVYSREYKLPWHWTHCSPAELPEELSRAEILENVAAKTGVAAIRVRSPGNEMSEGLYVVTDHDSYVSIAIAFPEVEELRVNANRSIMVKLMAQLALKMELRPCGLYLAVILLDFYWNHDRTQGRRMDSVQLHVLAYTCLYIASNRFIDPVLGRTPDEFCKWIGLGEGSVKGCMIIKQLEAFVKLLHPENVSSVTCQFLWNQLRQVANPVFKPELHMSFFIRELEMTDYGILHFNPAAAAVRAAHAIYDAHMAKASHVSKSDDPAGAMQRMLLIASRSALTKRRIHDMSMSDDAASNMNKRVKVIGPPKIAVL